MFAWRGYVGLIQPTHRGKSFHYWYRLAPPGVEIVPTFIGFRRGEREAFERAFDKAEEIAASLVDVGATLIAIGGLPPFALKGHEFDMAWTERLSRRLGVPVATPMHACALALKTMPILGPGPSDGAILRRAARDREPDRAPAWPARLASDRRSEPDSCLCPRD